VVRIWKPQGQPCPYDTGPDSLFIGYAVSAELGCHRKLGWPMPSCILDLYAEFRHRVCGLAHDDSCSLAKAMSYFSLPFIDAAEKHRWQMLCASSPNLSDEVREDVLNYCMTDVDAAERLLKVMLPKIDYPRCLIRGRYAKAVMDVEQNGLPIDVPYFRKFEASWDSVRAGLIQQQGHGLFVNVELDRRKFEPLLQQWGLLESWPRTETKLIKVDGDTLKDVARLNPILTDVCNLHSTLQSCKSIGLPIGTDGNARCAVRPYRTKTGRNAPKSQQFLFSRSAWFRHFLKPSEGMAVASLDYSAQEFAIAAVLSGDEVMLQAYLTGDPYAGTAIAAGLAPGGATKKTHPRERALMKPVVLGVLYGQGPWGIARRAGMTIPQATELLRKMQKAFPKFFAWWDQAVLAASLAGYQTTKLGWRVHLPAGCIPNARSLANHPVQGTGADILRVGSILAVERGVRLGAFVHDSIVVLGRSDTIHDSIATCQAAMMEAGRKVLGIDLRISLGGMVRDDQPDTPLCSSPVLPPGRYFDEDGYPTWRLIRRLCPPVK
jgi:hypothetical protein